MPSSKFEMDRGEVSHGTQGHGDGRCSMKFSFQRTIIAMSKTDYLSILQAGIQKAKQSSLDKAGEDRANRERKDARLRRITDIVGPRLADLEEQLKDAGIRVDRDPKFPGTPKDGVYVAFRLLPDSGEQNTPYISLLFQGFRKRVRRDRAREPRTRLPGCRRSAGACNTRGLGSRTRRSDVEDGRGRARCKLSRVWKHIGARHVRAAIPN